MNETSNCSERFQIGRIQNDLKGKTCAWMEINLAFLGNFCRTLACLCYSLKQKHLQDMHAIFITYVYSNSKPGGTI